MREDITPLDTLQDIKQIMQKSSRFISLSGLSGVAAGVCALAGAFYTFTKIECWARGDCQFDHLVREGGIDMQSRLLQIAAVTFFSALVLAFLFTYLRSKKTATPIWNYASRRLMINVAIPMIAGGFFIYRMMEMGFYGMVAPACLLFYGLALVNASKYTLGEIRYLGYGQLILGIINCWAIGYGLYFWAAGFGILHIVYGILMWYKYEAQGRSRE